MTSSVFPSKLKMNRNKALGVAGVIVLATGGLSWFGIDRAQAKDLCPGAPVYFGENLVDKDGNEGPARIRLSWNDDKSEACATLKHRDSADGKEAEGTLKIVSAVETKEDSRVSKWATDPLTVKTDNKCVTISAAFKWENVTYRLPETKQCGNGDPIKSTTTIKKANAPTVPTPTHDGPKNTGPNNAGPNNAGPNNAGPNNAGSNNARPNNDRPRNVDPVIVGSFNAMVYGRTIPGGAYYGKMPGSDERTRLLVEILRENKSSLVGLQEFMPPQAAEFRRVAGDEYGLAHPTGDTKNAIAYKRSQFELIRNESIRIHSYANERRAQPYALFRNKQTGEFIWFADFHNPANTATYPHQEQYRAMSKQVEIDLAHRLRETGRPVIVVGDMNEGSSYYCSMTRSGQMHAAQIGGDHRNGNCHPPASSHIDWIFGSNEVTFKHFSRQHGPKVQRSTDHAVYFVEVDLLQAKATLVPNPK